MPADTLDDDEPDTERPTRADIECHRVSERVSEEGGFSGLNDDPLRCFAKCLGRLFLDVQGVHFVFVDKCHSLFGPEEVELEICKRSPNNRWVGTVEHGLQDGVGTATGRGLRRITFGTLHKKYSFLQTVRPGRKPTNYCFRYVKGLDKTAGAWRDLLFPSLKTLIPTRGLARPVVCSISEHR